MPFKPPVPSPLFLPHGREELPLSQGTKTTNARAVGHRGLSSKVVKLSSWQAKAHGFDSQQCFGCNWLQVTHFLLQVTHFFVVKLPKNPPVYSPWLRSYPIVAVNDPIVSASYPIVSASYPKTHPFTARGCKVAPALPPAAGRKGEKTIKCHSFWPKLRFAQTKRAF